MGAQLGGSSGRGRRRGYRQLSEINVTPLVDVMLVLLIVFMVTAPLLTAGVPVDLPKSQARALPQEKDPLTVSVRQDGKIYVQENQVPLENLVPMLTAIAGEKGSDARVLVRGDQALNYGAIMTVLGTLNKAGFTKVGLVSESQKRQAAAR